MSRSKNILKVFRYVLMALAVSLLIFLVADFGFARIVEHLSSMRLDWLLLAFVCMAANLCLATLRYRCLIKADFSFLYFFEIILASFLLNYAAMVQGLGLAAKIGMLKTREVPVSHSSASIWLEICLDVLVCSVFVAIFLMIKVGPGSENLLFFAIPLALVVVASLSVVLVSRVPGRFEVVDQFLAAIAEISSSPRLFTALIYSAGVWISAAAGLYCILNALQPGVLTDLGLSVLAMTSGFLTGLVSLVPGGIGVRELTWSYVISQSGYTLQLAGLAAILYRILAIFLVASMLAVLSLAKRKAV